MEKYAEIWHICFMAQNSFISRKERHDRLIGLLKSQEIWTASELSAKLKVSLRTLMRDLADLIEMGIPIESERGRGGGIRLHQQWGLGKLQLSYGEILGLLLALATMEKLKSPLLLSHLNSVREKISVSFPGDQRKRIEQLRKRILVGMKASNEVLKSYQRPKEQVLQDLQISFFESRLLEIEYLNEKKVISKRVVEPHFLLLNHPIWYIQAWDHLRSDVRFFRIDRIKRTSLKTEFFGERPSAVFSKSTKEFFESI